MDDAARVVGAFLFLDLLAAFVLMILVGLSVRRGPGRKAALRAVAWMLLFLTLIAALIYGSLWLVLRTIV